MTAQEVIGLLRSLHRPSGPRGGCQTCHRVLTYDQARFIVWPCETAALLDSIERTLGQ